MTEPSDFERTLGRAIRSRFGSQTKVTSFGDEQSEHSAYIVSGMNCPVDGVTSYGSVGLYKTPQIAGTTSLSVEVLAACAENTPYIDHALASCITAVKKNRSQVVFGASIRNIVRQYDISIRLHHVAFFAPFLWDNMSKIQIGSETIYFLLMVPITDSELSYLEGNGADALEKRFVETQIDIFDINRDSAV